MARLRMEQTQSLQMQQELRQILRMEQATLLEMPEAEFNRLIAEIERGSFFKRLSQKERLIRHQRFPRTDISSSFYQLKEELVADEGSLDVESLLLNKEHIIHQIQKLGLEKFKRYFLFPESGMTLEEIARECDLEVSEVHRINNLIDDLSIMNEFYHPSNITSGVIRYSKVASIEKDETGFIIAYFSAFLARGRYLIDYERFEELKSAGEFTEAGVKGARQLFKKLQIATIKGKSDPMINSVISASSNDEKLILLRAFQQSLSPAEFLDLERTLYKNRIVSNELLKRLGSF